MITQRFHAAARRTGVAASCIAVLVSAFAASAGFAAEAASPQASELDPHLLTLMVCVAIFVGVFAVMFYSVLAHRKVAEGAGPWHATAAAELLWTVVPVLILLGSAWPAMRMVLVPQAASYAVQMNAPAPAQQSANAASTSRSVDPMPTSVQHRGGASRSNAAQHRDVERVSHAAPLDVQSTSLRVLAAATEVVR